MNACFVKEGRPVVAHVLVCGYVATCWYRVDVACCLLFGRPPLNCIHSSLLPHSGSDLQTLFKADKAIQKVLHYTLQQGGMVKYVAGKDDPTNEQRGKKLRKVVATGGGESGGGKVGTSLLDWEIRGVVEATLPSVR